MTSEARLSEDGEGKATLSGTLDFSSVPILWPGLQRLIGRESRLELSLAEVVSSNSAGLALLLEAVQQAAADAHEIRLADIPQGLLDLARLSNLTDVLGFSPHETSDSTQASA
jgi:phospholipid transport system transporter-binding protein